MITFARKINVTNHEPSRTDTLRAILHPSALKPFIILALYFLIYQFSGVNPVTFYAVEIIQVRFRGFEFIIVRVSVGVGVFLN